MWRHGDVLIASMEKVPAGAKAHVGAILAHGEVTGHSHLETLPDGLKTGTLILSGCTALQTLPENLDVYFLDLAGCTSLKSWPQMALVRVGRLDISGCTRMTHLLSCWNWPTARLPNCPPRFKTRRCVGAAFRLSRAWFSRRKPLKLSKFWAKPTPKNAAFCSNAWVAKSFCAKRAPDAGQRLRCRR